MPYLFQRVCIAALFLTALAAWSQTPSIVSGGVLNGASFDQTGQPVAPGSLISIFANNAAFASESATSVPLPGSLASVYVTMNGLVIPLKDVVHQESFDQINAEVPWEF